MIFSYLAIILISSAFSIIFFKHVNGAARLCSLLSLTIESFFRPPSSSILYKSRLQKCWMCYSQNMHFESRSVVSFCTTQHNLHGQEFFHDLGLLPRDYNDGWWDLLELIYLLRRYNRFLKMVKMAHWWVFW